MKLGVDVGAVVVAAGLLLSGDINAGSLEPPGPPAPTMKTMQQVEPRTPIASLPVTITAPGSYYLAGDLVGVSGQPGITITSSYVTLDLNGFALVGVGGSNEGVRATTAGLKHIAIRNGVVRNWGAAGVSALQVTELQVNELRLESNVGYGLIAGSGSIVRNTTAARNGGAGLYADVGSTVTGCTATSNTTFGISLGAGSTVSASTATLNGSSGFSLASGSVATDCAALSNSSGGFSMSPGSRVTQSTARQNLVGLAGGDNITVLECTVDANTDDGIRFFSHSLIRGNRLSGNANDGIHAQGNYNRIEDNHLTSNGTNIRVDGTNSLIIKNSVPLVGAGYVIAANNRVGPISSDPATAGPWANFSQ